MRHSEQLSDRDWRAIIRNIHRGKCTPLIGDRMVCHHIFGDDDINGAWAEDVDCPGSEAQHRASIAQYLGVEVNDPIQAKDEYLDFLKMRLLERVEQESSAESSSFLKTLEDQVSSGNISLVELARKLDLTDFASTPDNPFRILAGLPLAIYLTTSYHDFLEEVLRVADKEPRSGVCFWHEELEEEAPSIQKRDPGFNVFLDNPGFQPSENEPLVYHLHGRETYPASMVLSQDEHFDFLLRTSSHQDIIPSCVDSALASSSLLLLGYSLRCWDFRVILRGLIKAKETERRPKSVAIQLAREDRAYSRYLSKYFRKNKFVVFWGTAQEFLKELQRHFQGAA